jgi:hypothetical protein
MKIWVWGALSVALFIGRWVALNDSFPLSRDEAWYASYAMEWDASETNHIRHTTDKDLHQIAFLPAFRSVQRAILSDLTPNLTSLRLINLVAGVLLILCLTWTFSLVGLSGWVVFLFTSLVCFFSYLCAYSHSARPDWLVICLSCAIASLSHVFVQLKKVRYLYLASILTAISISLYWNGLAIAFAFGVFLLACLYTNKISKVTFLSVCGLGLVVLTPIFFIPVFKHDFLFMMTNDGIESSGGIRSNSTIGLYIHQLGQLFLNSFSGSKEKILLLLLSLGGLTLLAMNLKERKIRPSLLTLLCFFLLPILPMALRGDSARFFYFFVGNLFLLLTVTICVGLEVRSKWQRYGAKICCLFFVVCAFAFASNLWSNQRHRLGQWQAYVRYSMDLSEIIAPKERVLCSYQLAFTLPENPKFFREAFAFSPIESAEKLAWILDEGKVEYVVLTETDRARIEGKLLNPNHQGFHDKLAQALQNSFQQVGRVTNPFYGTSRGDPLKELNVTEVWKRRH